MCLGVITAAAGFISGRADTATSSDRSFSRSLQRLKKSLDENFENFGSEGAVVVSEIFEFIHEVEAAQELEADSDPDLEETFASMVDEVIHHPGQISEKVNEKITGLEESLTQGSFDRIGGSGTLREIWARLKTLHRVSGVKRKRADCDWQSYGPVGPAENEDWGRSPWSSASNYSSLNARQRSVSSVSSGTGDSIPSLATTETESSLSSVDSWGMDTSNEVGSSLSELGRGLQGVRLEFDSEITDESEPDQAIGDGPIAENEE